MYIPYPALLSPLLPCSSSPHPTPFYPTSHHLCTIPALPCPALCSLILPHPHPTTFTYLHDVWWVGLVEFTTNLWSRNKFLKMKKLKSVPLMVYFVIINILKMQLYQLVLDVYVGAQAHSSSVWHCYVTIISRYTHFKVHRCDQLIYGYMPIIRVGAAKNSILTKNVFLSHIGHSRYPNIKWIWPKKWFLHIEFFWYM